MTARSVRNDLMCSAVMSRGKIHPFLLWWNCKDLSIHCTYASSARGGVVLSGECGVNLIEKYHDRSMACENINANPEGGNKGVAFYL